MTPLGNDITCSSRTTFKFKICQSVECCLSLFQCFRTCGLSFETTVVDTGSRVIEIVVDLSDGIRTGIWCHLTVQQTVVNE